MTTEISLTSQSYRIRRSNAK